MILEFDLGNTSVKWRVLDADGRRRDGGRLDGVTERELQPLRGLSGITRIRVASVVAEGTERVLAGWCRDVFGVTPEFARTSSHCAGVQNSYADPERMGVDRWLAMLAAYRTARAPLAVIDLGSALTIDLVAGDGRHLGGYIIPGLALMQKTLLADTDRVRFDEADEGDWGEPGRSTAEAVLRGARLALAGAVTLALESAEQRLGAGFRVFLAGGDARLLAEATRQLDADRLTAQPELVMDGLAVALG